MKFKVGDKIRVIKVNPTTPEEHGWADSTYPKYGWIGTIVSSTKWGTGINKEWEIKWDTVKTHGNLLREWNMELYPPTPLTLEEAIEQAIQELQ